MSERRQQSVNRLLREVISEVIRSEMRDPRVKLVSVSSVEVSGDLRHAKVRLSVVGQDAEQCDEVYRAVDGAKAFIRRSVAEKIRLRFMPELTFVRDRTGEHAEKLQRIILELHKEEPPAPAPVAEEAPSEDPE